MTKGGGNDSGFENYGRGNKGSKEIERGKKRQTIVTEPYKRVLSLFALSVSYEGSVPLCSFFLKMTADAMRKCL
jgi:hypothetical protein